MDYARAQWRLIQSGFNDGRTNMAVDEAIMVAVAEGQAPPTIRMYGWEPFCLSTGYAQSMLKEIDIDACRAAGIDYVRRPTGGRAILHGDELTYSLLVSQDEPWVAGGVVESYRRLSIGLVEGLRSLGAEALQADVHPGSSQETSAACFDTPSHYEVTVRGRKLIGSAQMRRKGMVLQHGSLPLYGDITRIVHYLRFSAPDQQLQLKHDLRRRATTLEEVLGKAVHFDVVVAALAEGLARSLNLDLMPGDLTPHEQELAGSLRRDKYDTVQWNFQR